MLQRANKDIFWKIAMAFQESKALFVASELDVFTMLSKKPISGDRLAKKLKLHARPVIRLLNALVACGFLKKQNGKFFNSDLADTFLIKGKPEYSGDYLSIVSDVYQVWGNYEQVIRKNQALPLFQQANARETNTDIVLNRGPAQLVRRVMLAQEQFSYRQAVCLPEVYDFSKHNQLLDVGGGTGIFAIMAVKANAHLRAIVFDAPQVCEVARERIRFYKTGKKVEAIEGNFLTDKLPEGADVALLSTVLDGYDEPECRKLLKKVFCALKPKGTVIVNEMMLDEKRTGPLFPALFSLELMIERNCGDSRTEGEICRWMKDAGFANIRSKPLRARGETYLNCKIVAGRKP